MFDVSFTELLTIGVVALVVIGPERLPKVARTVGHLLGRAQRYVNDVKSDIRREMELEELRNLRKEMEDAAHALETTVKTNVDELHKGFNEVQQSVEDAAREVKQTATGERQEPVAGAAAPSLAPSPATETPALAAALPSAVPAEGSGEPPEVDPAQGSLFPGPQSPPANQPAVGLPAEASTVRERT